jgi:hypothetical protein
VSRALKHLFYFACRKDHTFEIHKQSIMRFWSLTAQRGWARLILERLDALAHSSAATTYARKCCRSCGDAAEHYNFFYPDHGNSTANSADFGWRDGGA